MFVLVASTYNNIWPIEYCTLGKSWPTRPTTGTGGKLQLEMVLQFPEPAALGGFTWRHTTDQSKS